MADLSVRESILGAFGFEAKRYTVLIADVERLANVSARPSLGARST